MKRFALLLFLLVAAPATGAAAGGPSPGVLTGGDGVLGPQAQVRYVAVGDVNRTMVEAVLAHSGRVVGSTSLQGSFGVPIVTADGATGGVSTDGQTLVLGSSPGSVTSFAIFDTHLSRAVRLQLRDLITLQGSYAYDAIAPDGSMLYVIQYVPGGTAARYRVRAYDLRAGRLLPGAIADKRLWGPYMRGTPFSRATTADGGWVYTLYGKPDGTAFVHALDTLHRSAVCVNLPWRRAQNALGLVRLSLAGRQLVLAQPGLGRLALVDTRSFNVTTIRKPAAPGDQLTR